MNLPAEIQILKLVTTKLEELAIPYMLSGSVASSFYAQPRMTRDIDIVIELAAEQIPKVLEVFSGDFYIDERSIIKYLGEKLNLEYIGYWIKELGVEQLWEEIKNE